MQLFNPDFGLYFLILVLLTVILYLTGGLVFGFLYLSESKYFRVFLNLLSGFIFWITLTALYFTKGNTIFIIIPVSILALRFILGWRLKSYIFPVEGIVKDGKVLLKEAWFLIFIFLLFAYKHILSNGRINDDYLYYSNVAYTLKHTGIEGKNFGMFSVNVISPYHYSDIWFTSLITEIFNTNYYHTIIFLSIPILLFIVYSGSIALIDAIGDRFYNGVKLSGTYLYACCMIIIGGLDYPILRKYMEGYIALIQQPKLSIVYAIFILAIIFLIRNNVKYAFYAVLLLTAFYTPVIFFVLPAVGILILISLFKNYRVGTKYLTYYLVIVLTFVGFYFFNSKFSNVVSPSIFRPNFIIEGLKSFPINFIKKSFRFTIVYLPFLLLFAYYIKDNFYSRFNNLKSSYSFLIMGIFLLSGYFFSFIFSAAFQLLVEDYTQVLYNGLLPLLAVYCFVILIVTVYEISIKKNKKYVYHKAILLFIIACGFILQLHREPRYWGHLEKIDVDTEFYIKLSKELKNKDRIASYQNFEPPTGYKDWFQHNYKLYPNLNRIANFNNQGVYYPECINVHEMDTTKSVHRKYHYTHSSFIHFLDSSRIINPKITPNEALDLFLKKHDFNYIIYPNKIKVPKEVQILIKDSIIRNDGFRVYRL